MPILLTRKNGPPTPFRNVEYLPLYYFIPKRILEQCGHELNSIPRIPKLVFADRNACNIIESDLFVNLIIDAVAYMVWPHMGFKEYMEIYSGYDPAWILAHSPAFWVQKLLDSKILPTANDLYKNGFEYFGYMPEGEITEILNWLVPHVMEKHNMQLQLEHHKFSKEEIAAWISRFKNGDVNDRDFQKEIMDIFVNSVYVYDDKLLLNYNYKDSTKTLTFDEINAALSSDIVPGSPPKQERHPKGCLFCFGGE